MAASSSLSLFHVSKTRGSERHEIRKRILRVPIESTDSCCNIVVVLFVIVSLGRHGLRKRTLGYSSDIVLCTNIVVPFGVYCGSVCSACR